MDQDRISYRRLWILLAIGTAIVSTVVLAIFRHDLLAAGLGKLVSIVTPFLYGGVIAYLLRPVSVGVEKLLNRLPGKKTGEKRAGAIRMISILLSIFLLLAALVLLVLTVVPEVVQSLTGLLAQLPPALERFTAWLSTMDTGETSHEAVEWINSIVNTVTERLQSFLRTDLLPQLQTMAAGVTSSLQGILGVLKNFGLGCIIAAYILGSWERFSRQAKLTVYAALPARAAEWVRQEAHVTDRMFSGFIHGKLLDSLIVGLICFAFCMLVRMPYTILVSLVVGVTNIIPFFGPYLGAIPSALLILTVSPMQCLVFLIFIILLQQLDGNVIGPKILGDRLGLSSFWILFSILVFGSLWGLVGMIVGAPFFAVLYDIIRSAVFRGLKKRGREDLKIAYRKQYPGKE